MPYYSVKTWKKEEFKDYETPSGIPKKQLSARHIGIPGFNLVRIDERAGKDAEGEVIIQVSAKILGRDYPQLITRETMPQVLTRINASGFIQLDSLAALEAAVPLLVHAAKDFPLSNPSECFRVMKLLHVNDRYHLTGYRNANTLCFENEVNTRKCQEYGKLYVKLLEFEMKKNQPFRESLSGPDLAHVRAQFKGMTRGELELKSGEKIYQYYEFDRAQPLRLRALLDSTVNPLAKAVNRLLLGMAVAPEKIEAELFFLGLSEKEKELFLRCKHYGFDLDRIKFQYVQAYPKRPATASEKFKQAKGMVSRFHAHNERLTKTDFALLTELADLVAN